MNALLVIIVLRVLQHQLNVPLVPIEVKRKENQNLIVSSALQVHSYPLKDLPFALSVVEVPPTETSLLIVHVLVNLEIGELQIINVFVR